MPKKIHSDQDSICLSIVHSVTKQKTVYQKLSGGEDYPEQKEVLVKQIHVRKWFRKDGITSVEEYVTSKNRVARSRSIVFDKYSGRFYATYHSAKDVMQNIHSTAPNPIGFKYDTKIYSSRP
jgi:predicted aminopeptidase